MSGLKMVVCEIVEAMPPLVAPVARQAVLSHGVLLFHVLCTSETNPAEGRQRPFTRATGNHLYENVEEVQEPINAVLQGEEIPVVRMFCYLAR